MKQEVLQMIPNAKRIGNGQRWVIELPDGTRALLKTNARSVLMVMAESGEVDSKLSGFGSDVSHVLIVTGKIGAFDAWLVPIDIAAQTVRQVHQKWLHNDPAHSRETKMRVTRRLDERFAGYEYPLQTKAITPDQARQGLAAHFNTTPDKIQISVDL